MTAQRVQRLQAARFADIVRADEHSHQRSARYRHAGCGVDDTGHPNAAAEK